MKRERPNFGAFFTALFVVLLGMIETAHAVNGAQPKEQSSFSCEQDATDEPIQRPVGLPENALSALGNDSGVAGCLAKNQKKVGAVASWFVASQIRLGGPDEVDFVVLPNLKSPGARCFMGANVAEFWVLRKTHERYELALSAGGHNLEVLDNRTNGFRDIMLATVEQAGEYVAEVTYTFDGQAYQKHSSILRPSR